MAGVAPPLDQRESEESKAGRVGCGAAATAGEAAAAASAAVAGTDDTAAASVSASVSAKVSSRAWGAWGDCNVNVCGTGTQSRTYTITVQSEGGVDCPVSTGATEEQACTGPACIDCEGAWGAWGECSASCGTGTKTRTYAVTTQAIGGAECVAADGSTENQECTSMDANGSPIECVGPVDCVGSWGAWGACGASCGSGTQTRTYTVSQQAEGGGLLWPAAEGDSEEQACDAGVACIDCDGAWGA